MPAIRAPAAVWQPSRLLEKMAIGQQMYMRAQQAKQQRESNRLAGEYMQGNQEAGAELARTNPQLYMGIEQQRAAQAAEEARGRAANAKMLRENSEYLENYNNRTGELMLKAGTDEERRSLFKGRMNTLKQRFPEQADFFEAEYTDDLAQKLMIMGMPEDERTTLFKNVSYYYTPGTPEFKREVQRQMEAKRAGAEKGAATTVNVGIGQGQKDIKDIEKEQKIKAEAAEAGEQVEAKSRQIETMNTMVGDLRSLIGQKQVDGKIVEDKDMKEAMEWMTGGSARPAEAFEFITSGATKLSDWKALRDTVVSNLELEAVQKLAGTGPISDAEMKKVADSAGLINKAQTEKAFVNAVERTIKSIQSAIASAERKRASQQEVVERGKQIAPVSMPDDQIKAEADAATMKYLP